MEAWLAPTMRMPWRKQTMATKVGSAVMPRIASQAPGARARVRPPAARPYRAKAAPVEPQM